jgi:hypothetical protein
MTIEVCDATNGNDSTSSPTSDGLWDESHLHSPHDEVLYWAETENRKKTENGKRKTENGKRKTENRKRKTENGKRKTENGKRKKENGKRKTESRTPLSTNKISKFWTKERANVTGIHKERSTENSAFRFEVLNTPPLFKPYSTYVHTE